MKANPAAIPGARKAPATATPEGEILRPPIDGVVSTSVPNIVTGNGVTCDAFRADRDGGGNGAEQVLVVTLRPRAISAWHCHERQTDRVAVVQGSIRLVLYDARDGSATRGTIQVHLLAPTRPTLVAVPPGVWHGLQNLEDAPAIFVNVFDRAYRHDDPDEWRLPVDTDAIPFRF